MGATKMSCLAQYLWVIPVLPLLAAAASALAKRRHRAFAATVAVGSMGLAFALSCAAFACVLRHTGSGETARQWFNFPWFRFGEAWVELGWVLDPLAAVMLVMVSMVGLLIFIYSLGYMAHDENFTRFFCFLSLFAAGMLGLVIANSLLLLFVCWELVGLTSYLLIGFWYHKPAAAAAAKKAFITTRLGDLAFLLGMVWLYSQTGTLLFYDDGLGCLEHSARVRLVMQGTTLGIAASTGIALLLFCGAIGKSGQVPLHVWLPDAMEGPTPVSALIHAATMVAAGVFLMARVYPLVSANYGLVTGNTAVAGSIALTVVTWVGAITAFFAATIAVAQSDLKRILAYSTVSQLGFMMLGLGVGGVAVGMFHLVTHAFFKALLFLGAGSVIHGCDGEQDVRRLGGLWKFMPVTFATYAIGMLALSGFPLLSGFWSKDDILHAAHGWRGSPWPFYLGVLGALLTAFYMTRQVCYVFFGNRRPAPGRATASEQRMGEQPGPGSFQHPQTGLASSEFRPGPYGVSGSQAGSSGTERLAQPHESPGVMLGPLIVLAVFALFLGFVGTPAWPWFQAFLSGIHPTPAVSRLLERDLLQLMLLSTVVVLAGIGLGWWLYAGRPAAEAGEADPLERLGPDLFTLWRRKYYVDEVYGWAVVGFNAWWAKRCDWLDRWVWNGGVNLLAYLTVGLSWLNRFFDECVVNLGFDEGCGRLRAGGGVLSRLQDGRVQNYLRILGVGLLLLALLLIWGCGRS